MLDSLAARGVLDNTIVIVTSDHGEHFGEHGLRGHANSLYLDVLHVPLYIRFPRKVPGGLRVPEPVTLRDLPATILDLADAPDSVIPGSSLARHWGGNSTSGSPLYAALSQGINLLPPARNAETSLESLADGRYRLIRSGAGNEELFDYMADPQELHNLVGDSALRNRLAGLRSGLATIEGYVVVPNGTTTARR
jgi:arylsulfatase A-like enzyme